MQNLKIIDFMNKVIGFANKFYTLWNHSTETNYTCISGKNFLTNIRHKYDYIKNISISEEKVKELYPDAPIIDGLRGRTISFWEDEKIELPIGYFGFGKYYGELIEDILAKDFQYCLWVVENREHCKSSEFIKSHPTYVAHIERIMQQEKALLESDNMLKVGDVVELEFERNGYNGWWSDGGKISRIYSEETDKYDACFLRTDKNGVEIIIECPCKFVGGIYPYLMPILNGKAQRTKGKKVVVTVTEIIENFVEGGSPKQMIKVK